MTTKRARKKEATMIQNDARKRENKELKAKIRYLEMHMQHGFEILYKRLEVLTKWQQDVIGGGNFKRSKKK